MELFELGPMDITPILDESLKGKSEKISNLAITMAAGNPGAANAIKSLLTDNPMGDSDLSILNSMGLAGPDIWVGYKDICDFDMGKFQQKIRNYALKSQVEGFYAAIAAGEGWPPRD